MLVKLENPSLLSRAIDLLSDLVLEARLKVNEYGMSIVAMDQANVAMVGFKLPKGAFSQFEATNETLGINLDNFKKILKRCGPKSILTLESNNDNLKIEISDRIKRNFSLSLIDVEGEDKEMPSLEFSSKVEINSLDLIDSIEDCSVVADSCAFIVEEDKFVIQAKGADSARAEFSKDQLTIDGEPSKSKYSLEYLQKFIKGAKLCEKTTLNFATNHPLKMSFRAQHLELNFILAPRVDSDD